MTPLLFPHTYISPKATEAAAHFFSHLRVYQPVDGYLPDDLLPWVESGFLKIHLPVIDDGDKVAAAVRDFQQWAQQHSHDRDLKTILPRIDDYRPPFFEDHATAQILTDLKTAPNKPDDPVKRSFNARLFLCLAQDFDLRRRELSDQLDRVDAKSRAMLDQLQFPAASEDLGSIDSRTISYEKTPEFMPSERLKAWTQLFLADSRNQSMLLTTSPSIIADLVSGSDPAYLLMQLKKEDFPSPGEPAAADSLTLLADKIEQARHQAPPLELQRAPIPVGEAEATFLTLYMFANQSLRSIIAKGAGLQPPGQIQPRREDTVAEHAVVGLLSSDRP